MRNRANLCRIAPKWSTSLDGEYKHTAFGDYSGFLGATWSYVGSRSSDFASSPATPPGQVDPAELQHLRGATWPGKWSLSFTLYGKNLSDSRGITNYSRSPSSPYSTVTVTQPRTIGLTLSAKF